MGLYLGAVAGVASWAFVAGMGTAAAPRARWFTVRVRALLVVIALPTLASVGAGMIGWWDAGNSLRFALALPLGAGIAAVVAAVAAGDLR